MSISPLKSTSDLSRYALQQAQGARQGSNVATGASGGLDAIAATSLNADSLLGRGVQGIGDSTGSSDGSTDGNSVDMVSTGKPTKLGDGKLQEAFQDFVGQTFFSELIKPMRTSQKGAAYFHGGRAEEIFQGQFDQMMSEKLSDSSADKISEPMFELFQLGRVQ